MNAAREKVRVAHALATLPAISAAFESGTLSYSKVRAMTRIADESNEDYLLMIAEHGTAHHVEKLVSKYRTSKRLQDAEIANEQYNNRELNHYYDHDGCLVLKARLPAAQGALIVKALEMAMDKDFCSCDEPEPVATRRADALANVAETYLNNSEVCGSAADRYQVVVHVTAEQELTGRSSSIAAGSQYIEDGPGVTAGTSRRIACDSSVVCIHEDRHSEPLSIGRRSRSIPPPMRRALRTRDKGCCFPGCTNTRYVDGHHIEHWADGGETSLDNLVLLCRHHHHLVHEGGFGCRKRSDGGVAFTNPQQQALESQTHLPGMPSDQELQTWLDSAFFDISINSETCTTNWQAGNKMDWQMAVSALF